MTCVTAGCARTFANAFRPTNPVAPRIRTFIANTQLSCKLSQVIIQVNLQELTHSFGVILPNIGYGFHASAVLAFQSASKIFSSCAFSYANCPIRARHLHPPNSSLYVEEVIAECRQKRLTRVDILGIELEMGPFPNVLQDASAKAAINW
jgi:hypothetical protein